MIRGVKVSDVTCLKRNEGKGSKTAFVFSCPGLEEAKNNRLVSGNTGKNLSALIKVLRDEYDLSHYFHSENRYDYRITNASEKIYYKAKDGKTEASIKEIMEKDNLERLYGDLKGFELIIAFGDRAKMATEKCEDRLEGSHILLVRHLSYQSINQIKQDIHGKEITNLDKKSGPINTYKRLQVIGKEVAEALYLSDL